MRAAHTPGPWDQSNGVIFGSTANAIATIHRHQSPTVTLANARVIVAAPELLEALALAWHALKAADSIVFRAGGEGAVSVQLAQARDKARAAIAKATGAT